MTPSVFAPLTRLFLLLVLFMGAAMPALAQTEAPAQEEQAAPQQALAQLVEVLRDDAAREALIAELEASASAAEGAIAEEAVTIEEVARDELRRDDLVVLRPHLDLVRQDKGDKVSARRLPLFRQRTGTYRCEHPELLGSDVSQIRRI